MQQYTNNYCTCIDNLHRGSRKSIEIKKKNMPAKKIFLRFHKNSCCTSYIGKALEIGNVTNLSYDMA